MRIFQLQLYIIICCQAAAADLLTDLGSNVTINCDLDEIEVYWILQKTPDPPSVFLRSFLAPASYLYLNTTFKSKYSVQFKHCLVINNVTADELGVYYCMKTGTPPKFSNSTRIDMPKLKQFAGLPECRNHTVVKVIDQNQTQWQIFVISALLCGLLLIVLIVFAAGKTDCLEKQNQDADLLQCRVMYEAQTNKCADGHFEIKCLASQQH